MPPADFHGHELQGLVKMRQLKKYLNSLEKLSHFGVENFNDLFSFLDFINVLFQVTLRGVRLLWGGCKYLVQGTLMGEDFLIFD